MSPERIKRIGEAAGKIDRAYSAFLWHLTELEALLQLFAGFSRYQRDPIDDVCCNCGTPGDTVRRAFRDLARRESER